MGWRETAEQHDSILRELNEERAATLARISRTLESLIDQLHAAGDRIMHGHARDRQHEIAAYRELRARALTYRWYLEVQRESLGLRQHHGLDEFYPIPPVIPDVG
jgi:hypothetical protein